MSARNQKSKIIYIGDPLCSWCYGFAPEILKVKTHFESFHFQLVIGGLRPYSKDKMKDLGDTLEKHWNAVGSKTGQPFNYDILKSTSFVYDTEPPARAVIVMRELNRRAEFDFFNEVQSLFYEKNQDTNNAKTYLPLLDKYEVDQDEFENTFESAWAKMEVKKDFQLTQQMGVKGFPAVVLDYGGKLMLVTKGYAEGGKIIKAIEGVVNN